MPPEIQLSPQVPQSGMAKHASAFVVFHVPLFSAEQWAQHVNGWVYAPPLHCSESGLPASCAIQAPPFAAHHPQMLCDVQDPQVLWLAQ